MPLFLIAYDLDKPGQNYAAVHEQLEEWGAKRVLESTWMLNTDLTTEEMRDTLTDTKGPFESTDRVVIVRVKIWSSFNAMADIHEIEHPR
jgi:CRISPR/Cas system-associated endoribonuclease Cas2